MKKLLLLFAAFAIFSCENEPEVPKDYVTFSGKIENKKSDSLYIRSRTYSKTIKVNNDGTFKDTLKVVSGVFNVFDGEDGTSVYLENDYDVSLSADAENYMETVKFSGKGAINSNFLAESRRKSEKILDIDKLSSLDPDALNNRLDEIKAELTTYFKSQKDVDSLLISTSLKDINPMINYYKGFIGKMSAIKRKFPKGTPSPTFNYDNHKGGKTSLADLKGKYVYIDMWATWCGPCIAQIPALKKIEEKYEDKNIAFVSISVDQNKDAWVKMVTDKSLGGIQLHFGGDQTFSNEYMISGIPRFILLDTEGKVVSPDAPRPADPKLVEMFDELNI